MVTCNKKRKYVWRFLPPLLMATAFWFVASDVKATHTDVLETEDVKNTKHNLTENPDVKAGGPGGMSEVCIFCHTPHGANTVVQAMAPLWNRALPIDTTYQTYGSPNFDGAGPTAGKPKGVSLACLSCHDGTVAVDALINGPGSGGYINDNTITGGSTSSPLITLTANGIIDVANSSMLEGVRNGADQTTASCSPYCGGIHDTLTDTSLAEGAQPFPNLGINLGDDHPVGMQVPISGFNAEGGGGTSTDPQFALIGTFSTVGPGGVDGVNVKFISKDGILAADKRDRLRAYPSTTSAGLAGAYYIECASCHNPHTPRVSFLRLPSSLKKPNGSYEHIDGPTDPIPATWSSVDSNLKWGNKPNSGSAICLSCHQK